MKTHLIIIGLLIFSLSCQKKEQDRIEQLIDQMTLKEKVGQMTQLSIDMISVGEVFHLEVPNRLDTAKLRKAIVEYGVGSILNIGGHAYDLEHWRTILQAIQDMAVGQTRLGIPVLYGIDAIHGANYLLEGTLFPQPLAQAATFDPALVEKVAEITAYETRASGIPWNFSPVLDVARQPLWSRVFETYGEDVFLCRTMGRSAVSGYQSSDPSDPEHVAACMKHFLGYSMPFTGKDRTPVYLHERQLREYFLPTFQDAIDEGALSVMINSGELNGIPVHASKEILTDLLRTELGFDGVAVTDWEDIMKLEYPHAVAKDLREAVKIAVNAGIDMSMVPNDYRFSDLLVELVEAGEVPMARIDEAVGRILRMKQRLGLFKDPLPHRTRAFELVGGEEFESFSTQVARESITLLKNEGILPLQADKQILFTGPAAHSLNMLNGSWSRTWQGTDTTWNDNSKQTLWEAAKGRLKAVFVEGCTLDRITDLDRARNAALKSDLIVACMGEGPSTEKPGDIGSLDLEREQVRYIQELASTGKPIVLVLVQNRMRIIQQIEPLCQAILLAYQPSDNGADAVIDILEGKANPSGKLPVTYPRSTSSLISYDHKHTERLHTDFSYSAFNPQFEFGHGLSYSSFSYGPIELETDTFGMNDTIRISMSVSNTSERDGKETVLVFVKDLKASVTPPFKRLRAFDKQTIPAGAMHRFSFSIPVSDLAFVGQDLTWITEEGEHVISIGGQERPIYLK